MSSFRVLLRDGDRVGVVYKNKKPVKMAFDGSCKLCVLYEASKSNTKDGNIPRAMFSTIATTATA